MDNGFYTKVNNLESDDTIREELKSLPNGYYTVEVCRNCGNFWSSPDGDIDTMEIIDLCEYCFRRKGKQCQPAV